MLQITGFITLGRCVAKNGRRKKAEMWRGRRNLASNPGEGGGTRGVRHTGMCRSNRSLF